MALADYRIGFSEYQSGYLSSLHILSAPVLPKYDVDISTEDQQKLEDLRTRAGKNQSSVAALFGHSVADKANLLSRLARQLETSVCVVECALLVTEFIGETEKNLARLIADAQSKHWLLFFDEADALFGCGAELSTLLQNERKLEDKLLLDRLFTYQGLSLLSLTHPSCLDQIKYRLSCVIHCR